MKLTMKDPIDLDSPSINQALRIFIRQINIDKKHFIIFAFRACKVSNIHYICITLRSSYHDITMHGVYNQIITHPN